MAKKISNKLPKLRIKEPRQEKSIKPTEDNYPLFCFKYLSNASIKDCEDHDFFYKFIMRLNKLSELGWEQIRISGRHGFGLESLPIHEIKKELPSIITPEVRNLHVFRAVGDNRPFIGLQRGRIFHILFIESKFGDIYH